MITIDVLGTPAPKGSARAILVGGFARLIPGGSDANKRALQKWDTCVRGHARIAMTGHALYEDTALAVSIVFYMVRPQNHFGTGKNTEALKLNAPISPTTKPDIDKLARATLDSLTGLVWDDDSRIVLLSVTKSYAEPACGRHEGAHIEVGLG